MCLSAIRIGTGMAISVCCMILRCRNIINGVVSRVEHPSVGHLDFE